MFRTCVLSNLSLIYWLQVDGVWEDEMVEVSWTNPNKAFPDGGRVPLELRVYQMSPNRTVKTLLSSELINQSDLANTTIIPYSSIACPTDSVDGEEGGGTTPCQPWELGFSLGLQGQTESSVQGLLETFSLLPPENITLECEEACQVNWCLGEQQQHFLVNNEILKLLPFNICRKKLWLCWMFFLAVI